MFQIVFKPSASKEFGALPRPVQVRFSQAFPQLQKDPFRSRPGLHIRPLRGPIPEWRLRIGHCRGIYVIDAPTIRFTKFGHRSTVYR